MDEHGYPEQKELAQIKRFKFLRWSDVLDLLEHIRALWNYGDAGGFILTGKNTLKLELHTYGWSGNEDIIGALMGNALFWALFWQSSRRGGHYKFEIRRSMFKS